MVIVGTDPASGGTMKDETIPFRPFGLVINMLEEAGLVYCHCYEDLVFVESSVVLFKMGEQAKEVFVYTLVDCPDKTAQDLQIRLTLAAKKEGLTLIPSGRYKINEGEKNKIDLEFLADA